MRADLKQGAANDEQADGKSYVTRHGANLFKGSFGSVLLIPYTENLATVGNADLLSLVVDHPDPHIMANPV